MTNWMDEIEESPVIPNLEWSQYQLDLFEFVENGKGNAVVEAVAGSGKTTSLLKALEYTDEESDVAFVAFNKHIATELSEKAPAHVHVSTLHSLGFKNIRDYYPGRVKVDNRKMFWLFKDYEKANKNDADKLYENKSTILRLISLLKGTLMPIEIESIEYLSNRFGINTNDSINFIYRVVENLWRKSYTQMSKKIDFDDMVFASASGMVNCHQFDFLFVDEAQDLNNAQIKMVLKSVKPNSGRVICVGDRFQAIYGFRGSDTSAIPNLIEKLNAATLPLSITYRCPVKIVDKAREFVPHIEAAPNAIEGMITNILDSELIEHVEEGDMVLCRLNAPLVAPAFELIRNGVKAIILGREIGTGLSNFIDRINRKFMPTDFREFLLDMSKYTNAQSEKLIRKGKESQAIQLQDKASTIYALSEDCESTQEIKKKIAEVFSDNRIGVTFSSVHKAKGGEANNVYILRPDMMPHPLAKSNWQMQEEKNVEYVAITRAKDTLIYVEDTK